MNSTHVGLGAFAGASLTLMGAAALLWGGSPNHETASASTTARPATGQSESPSNQVANRLLQAMPRPLASDIAERLVRRFIEHLGRAGDEDDERAAIEREMLALGEAAAAPLINHLKHEEDAERRYLLLDYLRKIPGRDAEDYFIDQARQATERPTRALAIDALADRKSDRAFDALDGIATTDPEVPKKPFLTAPRGPRDDSTELPDEVTFTPRMQAMAALASTGDLRATVTLSSIVRSEPDESLRMEAARDLGQLRGDPAAIDALLGALGDRSAYVRLAALHSLSSVADPRLAALLAKIASTDSDLGVRALAERVLQQLSSAPYGCRWKSDCESRLHTLIRHTRAARRARRL